MALTFRAMFAPCPTTQTGITSPPRATAIHSQVQLAIGPGIIRAAHTTMEQVTRYILVHAVDSITTTAMDIRHTYLNAIFGKSMKESLAD